MKTTLLRISAACLLLACACALPFHALGQSGQPSARKFDEFTAGTGSPYARWNREWEDKELKERFRLYAAQLRKEGARPYAITYGPRVVPWEGYPKSIADRRASALWTYLTPLGFDWRQINWADGGFREEAATELWVVPPGAQPPCPTPTVRPEDVAYCPSVNVSGHAYLPEPSGSVRFRAKVSVKGGKVAPTFSWRVSRGRIAEGQGTDAIVVELPAGARGPVVARVEVGGYSLECPPGPSSAFWKTTVGVSHFKADEFGDIRMGDTKARLDNLAVELQVNPALQAHLVVYGARQGPRGQAARRAAQLKNYLVQTRGIDASRVFTVEGGFRSELSGELWLSPRGSPAPPARPTVDEGYVTPKGDVRPKP